MIKIADTQIDNFAEAKGILSEQAALLSSCAWVLENPTLKGPNGQDMTASVAVLLHSAEKELRRVARGLDSLE